MSIAIQLSEAPERDPSMTEYREGFQKYVLSVLGPETKVVVTEIHPTRMTELKKSWASHANTSFQDAKIGLTASGRQVGYWNPSGGMEAPISYSARTAKRYSPNAKIEQIDIPELDWLEWSRGFGLASESTIDLLSIDLDEENLFADLELLNQIQRIKILSVGFTNLTLASRKCLDRYLHSAGFRKSGRLWGIAGTSQAYTREPDFISRISSVRSQSKIRAGEFISNTRITQDSWKRFRSHAKAGSENRRTQSKVNLRIDPAPGFPLPTVPRIEVAELARRVEHLTDAVVINPWPIEIAPAVLSDECFRMHGVRPISFSFPGEIAPQSSSPRVPLSPIIPGYPYSFTDHAAYMQTYQAAQLGITHRKAGWDCFRHVEILAAGAIPLMVDAKDIPRYTMVHYPKNAMTAVTRHVADEGFLPELKVHEFFANHFANHLTSRTMAQYVLETSGLSDVERILFVDENLPHTADYQSVLTLIGLKQLLGAKCEVAFPVDWIYSDSNIDTSTLYGRGFGYSKVLDSRLKSKSELLGASGVGVSNLVDIDAIVVGSISRNARLAGRLAQEFPPAQTIWVHGEDRPPTVSEMASYLDVGASIFLRSIES